MPKYHLTIPGEPLGKARARITRAGINYTPAKTKNYEVFVKELFAAKYGSPMLQGGLCATITAFYGLNKGDHGKHGLNKKGKDKLSGTLRPTKAPDADNISKVILDALNKLAFADDSQIVSLTVEKYYAEKPRVELTLHEVGGES
jgi:Holliday junction resolvase RusA-like endonuclease